MPDKRYELVVEDQPIDLKGLWQYKLGARMETLAPQTFIRWKPGGLYNAMIAPLLNYSIKGVIWYQGESNADRPRVLTCTMRPACLQRPSEQISTKQGHWHLPYLLALMVSATRNSAISPSDGLCRRRKKLD